MNQKTMKIESILRLFALAAVAIVLGGCSTYYQSYYPDSGVYYEDSGVYGHSPGYSRGGYGPVNPVDYPYWSIDYFYFSQYYHPYSVYVGYNEPLYYPYPGWAFGRYRPARWHGSLAFGFGYPWYGHGYRYPAYTFGFFSGYDPFYHGGHYRRDRHGHHKIRQIDRRLEALQQGDTYASRRELLGRDRVARTSPGSLYDSRGRDRANATRSQTRGDLLRQRSAGGSRALQRREAMPDRSIDRRASSPRTDRRADRRTLDRDRIRREGGGSAYQGHRGVPIENLRGRVIVNSRNGRVGGRQDRNLDRDLNRDVNRDLNRDVSHKTNTARSIRRAPAGEWNRGEARSRQAPDRAQRRVDDSARGSLLNRSNRSSGAAPQRPTRRAAPPPRPTRDVSRPEPSSSSSSSTRRSLQRQRSGGDSRDRRGKRRR